MHVLCGLGKVLQFCLSGSYELRLRERGWSEHRWLQSQRCLAHFWVSGENWSFQSLRCEGSNSGDSVSSGGYWHDTSSSDRSYYEWDSNLNSSLSDLFSVDLRKVLSDVIHSTVDVSFGVCEVGLDSFTHFVQTENLNRSFPEFWLWNIGSCSIIATLWRRITISLRILFVLTLSSVWTTVIWLINWNRYWNELLLRMLWTEPSIIETSADIVESSIKVLAYIG